MAAAADGGGGASRRRDAGVRRCAGPLRERGVETFLVTATRGQTAGDISVIAPGSAGASGDRGAGAHPREGVARGGRGARHPRTSRCSTTAISSSIARIVREAVAAIARAHPAGPSAGRAHVRARRRLRPSRSHRDLPVDDRGGDRRRPTPATRPSSARRMRCRSSTTWPGRADLGRVSGRLQEADRPRSTASSGRRRRGRTGRSPR